MLRLHGFGQSRWTRPYWLLGELGVPFEAIEASPLAGDTRKPAFLEKNPFGKVPVLEDDTLTLFDSGAIYLYLAERYGDGKLLPRDAEARARCIQWVLFAGGDLEAPLWRVFKHTRLLPETLRIPADVELAKREFARLASALESVLGAHAVGESFTVADVMLASTLRWASSLQLLGDFPKLAAYVERHTSRAAFPRELYR
jgi:glutathione S-transferase